MGYAAAYINLFLIDEVGDNEYVIKGAELGGQKKPVATWKVVGVRTEWDGCRLRTGC